MNNAIRLHTIFSFKSYLLFIFYLLFSTSVNADTLVGSIPGSFDVSSTGAAQYSIPIEIPPGTAGVQPQLSLNYSSQGGNGLLGVGWSIGGLSSISRCPATLEKDDFVGGINFDGDDRFCLDGQPLVAITGTYGDPNTEYRTELDGFSKIISYGTAGNGPSYFIVQTKSGDTMEYGNTSDSQFNPPKADGTQQNDALYWSLNKVTDSVGNYMEFIYATNDNTTGETYLEEIKYTGNSTQSLVPFNSINFSYENRSDTNEKFIAGLQVNSFKRLSDITINSNSSNLNNYHINYSQGNATSRSIIIEIEKCDVNNDCVKPTNILTSLDDDGWASNTAYEPPEPIVRQGDDGGVRIIDINGDGLPDFLQARKKDSGASEISAYLNTGTGWASNTAYEPPELIVRLDGVDGGVRIIDINGDGLPDFLYGRRTSLGVIETSAYLNTGTGWASNTAYEPPQPIIRQGDDGGVRIIDINGDGLPDFLQARKKTSGADEVNAYLNTGTGWASNTAYEPPELIVRLDGVDGGVRIIDINGDGLPDFLYARRTSSGVIETSALLNKLSIPDSLENIKNGLGINIDIEYKNITDDSVYSNGSYTKRIFKQESLTTGEADECAQDYLSTTCPIRTIQFPLLVVSESRTDNGVGTQNTLSYQYEGAKAHLLGRGFLGFAQRTVEDLSTGSTIEMNYRQDFPFTGLVSSTFTRHGSTLVSDEQNTHHQVSTHASSVSGATDSVFIYTQQSVAKSNDLDTGALITTTTTTSTYDDFGNPTQIIATTNDVGEPSFVTTTDNLYDNDDTSKWHLGRLTHATVLKTLGGISSPRRTSSFKYHSVTGLLTEEVIEPNSGQTVMFASGLNLTLTSTTELKKVYAHDGFGNRLSVTTSGSGITTRTTSTTYDPQGRYALTATNALGHTETRVYNDPWGNITKLTGPNSLDTDWEYDTLGRREKETRADGTVTDITYTSCETSNSCPTLENGIVPSYFMTTTSTGAPTSIAYYDAVNRVVLTETQNFSGDDVKVQTEYDARARVKRTSLPYTSSTPNYWTTNTYDTLDRLTQVNSSATGITTYAYDGLKITVTNDLNQDASEKKNSRGQVLWSEDHDSNQVSFTYDAAGNLTHVSDGTNITINGYDLRGFKTSMDDPDMGIWKYEYNVLGELVKQWDAKTNHSGPPTVTMTYDVLGRLKTRTESEGTTTWNYDTATKGKGKLASISHYGGHSRTQTYDSLGRPSTSTTTISGINYTTTTTYYTTGVDLGKLNTIAYPTGFEVKHLYTTEGFLEKVVNAQTQSTIYWQGTNMDEFGNYTTSFVGSIVTEKMFKPNSGRLEDIKTGFTTVQNLAYEFDTLGNLKQRKDVIQNKTEDFLYDDLNRLTDADVVGGVSKDFAYDTLGNITSKTGVGSYVYNNAGPHAVTSTSGSVNATYTYDANGNMLTGNGRSMVWSSYNKPTFISRGSDSTTFSYGPDRARYRQIASDGSTTTTTTYIGGLYEKIDKTGSATQHKHYIRAAGQTIAIHNTYSSGADNTHYLHRDHLGSVDVITDENLNVIERLSFDAFGQRRQVNWSDAISQITSNITRGYTGHEQLDGVGLIHMNGRVYDPELGRFLSADPFVQFPKNLQSLNRYTYVQNNPLSFTDPSGFFLDAVKDFVSDVAGGVFDLINDAADAFVDLQTSLYKAFASATGTVLNAINSNPITGNLARAAACSAGPHYCAAYSAASAYAATGSLTGSIRAGSFAYAGASLFPSNSEINFEWAVTNVASSIDERAGALVGFSLSADISSTGNFLKGLKDEVVTHYVTAFAEKHVGRFAEKQGLSLYEFNVLLAGNSRIGNTLVGTGLRVSDGGFAVDVRVYGWLSRINSSGQQVTGASKAIGFVFDINDTILGYQGLIDATGVDYINHNVASGEKIALGHSLGALRSNNLVRNGFAPAANLYSLPFGNSSAPGTTNFNGQFDVVNGGIFGLGINPGAYAPFTGVSPPSNHFLNCWGSYSPDSGGYTNC